MQVDRPYHLALTLAVLVGLCALLPACAPDEKGAQSPGAAQEEGNAPTAAAQPPEVKVIPVEQVAELLESSDGEFTVVNLWATWCPPCVAEMPELAEFYREHGGDKIAFLSLSYDKPEDLEKVKAFHEKRNLPFPVYVLGEMAQPEDIDEALGTVFGGALPTTFIFDDTGAVVKMWEGAITLEMLKEAVADLA